MIRAQPFDADPAGEAFEPLPTCAAAPDIALALMSDAALTAACDRAIRASDRHQAVPGHWLHFAAFALRRDLVRLGRATVFDRCWRRCAVVGGRAP
ncbi:hypothetical protein [Jannaschia sp. M317]|uniref:hypothetical protein n=1 Tax=Jannaschia sp. M317 TaxID=2867011 RepID=UPI0021A3193F|nr:hypothetical protein [Jannaschia sp. M317]UWQ16141.1 hypothetical protein K3551_09330 [Jannaschia sp. M317]